MKEYMQQTMQKMEQIFDQMLAMYCVVISCSYVITQQEGDFPDIRICMVSKSSQHLRMSAYISGKSQCAML